MSQKVRIPGWRSTLRISPLSSPIDIRHGSRSAHGALSLILNQGHEPKVPNFCFVAGRDYAVTAVHWLHPAAWGLSDSRHRVELYGALRQVQIGPMEERFIEKPEPGAYLVQVETDTPMIIRKTGTRLSINRVDPGMLIGALKQSTRKWCDGEPGARQIVGCPLDDIPMTWTVVSQQHLPFTLGWDDRVRGGIVFKAAVATNHHGLLALRLLAELGMGTSPSRGYGRIVLRQATRYEVRS